MMKRVIAACAVLLAAAAAEAQTYRCSQAIEAASFECISGCTATTKGSESKPIRRLTAGGKAKAVAFFPDVVGVCTGGTNDDTQCASTSTCTGGGRCAMFVDYVVDVSVTHDPNAPDPNEVICIDVYPPEVTAIDAEWGENDGEDGTADSGTTTVGDTSDVTRPILIEDAEFYDQANAQKCTPENCGPAKGTGKAVIIVERPVTCSGGVGEAVDVEAVLIGCVALP